ncbi:MAG: segregation/condensation protein A [Candidatus Margulisiibacteriota bacterium]
MDMIEQSAQIEAPERVKILPEAALEDSGLKKFSVHLPGFEGHFESLLTLIESEAVDICDISLSLVTLQYLEYLSLAQALDLNYSSEFLLVASYLLESKSKKLLPIEEEEEIEEIESSLVDHVAQYRVFKKMAAFLKNKKEEFSKVFHRFRFEPLSGGQKQYFLKDVAVSDLTDAFRKIWAEVNEKKEGFEIVDELITVEDKIKDISERLAASSGPVGFESLFRTKTRLEIIVTFLAMLELIRLKKVILKQESFFGQIFLFPFQESLSK